MIFASLRLAHVLLFRLVGFAFFLIARKRRQIAKININSCRSRIFSESNIKTSSTFCAAKSFCSLGQTLADLLILNFYTKKNIDRFVSCKDLERIEAAAESGNGVIIASSHFGSWELAGHFLALKGYKSLIIYNKFKHSSFVESFVKKQRQSSGNLLIEKHNSMIKAFKHLKRGGIIIILADQHAAPEEGSQSRLLGHRVSCHSGFIRLAAKVEAAIVPAVILNHGLFKYSVETCDPIWPHKIESSLRIEKTLQHTNLFLERMITAAPEQWMWQHRRFKGAIDYPAPSWLSTRMD